MKLCLSFCFFVFSAAATIVSPSAHAQEGNFDPSWNGNGRRVVDFGSESDAARYMLVAPDDKVLLAGWCGLSSGEAGNACAVRLQPNGALDAGFGISGTGILQLDELAATPLSYMSGLVRAGDGALWFAGKTLATSEVSLTRLDQDGTSVLGSLAFHFNALPTQPISEVHAVVAAPDNAIVVAGTKRRDNTSARDIAVARLLVDANGGIALDPAFGTNGVATIGYGNAVTRIIVLDDGRILISGMATGNVGAGLAPGFVMRLLADGSLDTTFGVAVGFTQLRLCTDSAGGYAPDIAIDPQGRIATAYTARYVAPDLTELDSEICVNRLLPDGQQDGSFGGVQVPGGTGRPVRVDIGGSLFFGSIAVGADSKIIVGGINAGVGTSCAALCFMVARLNVFPRNGTVLDPGFGNAGAGVSRYDDGADSSDNTAIAIGNDGLMIAGSSFDLFEPFLPYRFGVAKVQLGRAAFDAVFADEFE